jgi:hypothetical protein
MYVKRDTKARSQNHCCREKALLYISVCVVCACVCGVGVEARARACSLAHVHLTIQHVTRMAQYCLRPLWLHQIFRYYLINDTIFGKKKSY